MKLQIQSTGSAAARAHKNELYHYNNLTLMKALVICMGRLIPSSESSIFGVNSILQGSERKMAIFIMVA